MEFEKFEEASSLSVDQLKARMELKVELFNILEEEELIWFKSHETWFLKGDNNTEYFHRIANGKKRKQTIFSSQTEGGTVMGTDKLLQYATEYYKVLFGVEGGNAFDLDPNLWPLEEMVNEHENSDLTKPFTEEETKCALFQMEKNKATGHDGFPIEFFLEVLGFHKEGYV
jgi:hypothetical protein